MPDKFNPSSSVFVSDSQIHHTHCIEEINYYKTRLLELENEQLRLRDELNMAEMEVLRVTTYVRDFLVEWINIQKKRCDAQVASILHFMDDRNATPKGY